MKKLISVLLAILMLFSTATVAFAAEDATPDAPAVSEENKELAKVYYRFDDEERDCDLIQRAWDMYDTVRQYNRQVIDGSKAVLRGR